MRKHAGVPRTIDHVPGSAEDPQPARKAAPDLGQRNRVYLVTSVLQTDPSVGGRSAPVPGPPLSAHQVSPVLP